MRDGVDYGGTVTMQTSKDILAVVPDRVPDFIQRHASARTLSGLVKRLNADLLDGDPAARLMAARALDHLGFMTAD
jgi:hypothetical protein